MPMQTQMRGRGIVLAHSHPWCWKGWWTAPALAALPQGKTHYQCQFMGLSYGGDGPRIVI
jgi:hypothetical protein